MTVPRTLTADDDPPIGSIVVDIDGDAYQLRSLNKWHTACVWSDETLLLSLLIERYGPLTLIWEPTTTKETP